MGIAEFNHGVGVYNPMLLTQYPQILVTDIEYALKKYSLSVKKS